MHKESGTKKKEISRLAEPARSPFCFTTHATQRAFSIIETIVAIAILSIAMVSPLALAQRGLNASAYARDQVTAFYLAQEAVEYVRYIRDNNNLASLSGTNQWLTGLSTCVADGGHPTQLCGIDVTSASSNIVDCTGDQTSCRVYFNTTLGTYGLQTGSGWSPTIYTRTTRITPVTVSGDVNGSANVVTTVSWKSGLITRTLTLDEEIFNWFPIAPTP